MNKVWPTMAMALILFNARAEPRSGFGGNLVREPVQDGFVDAVRVARDFAYLDTSGTRWPVSDGQVFGGKPLPRLFRDAAGPFYEGNLRKSLVLYESTARRMTETCGRAQRMFFESGIAKGMPAPEARVLYLTLLIQGTHWEVPGSGCFGVCNMESVPLEWWPVADHARTAELMQWVRHPNPDLEEIDRQGQSAIRAPGPHIFAQPACNEFFGSIRIRKSCD